MPDKDTAEKFSAAVGKQAELKFTKQQLVNSEKYFNRKDLVNTLLEDGKEYSYSETEKIINDFLQRPIL